jgi:geranylgeranyl reductase family protein
VNLQRASSFASQIVNIRKDYRMAVLINREKFDQYLVNKAVEAGATFLPGEAVDDIEVRKDGVAVRTEKAEYQALYLIGADGANSLVGRKIRPPFSRDEMAAALVGYVPADNRDIDERLGGSLDMYFGAAPMGYGWVFPHDGYYNVGIMGIASKFSAPRKTFTEFARSVGMTVSQTRGHIIPLGGIRRKIAAGRMLLVGDAAGFADPFHGEGIAHAIHSGKLAAQAVADSITRKQGSF